ncbi:MAG: hypothetical protein KAR20_27750, partial [Candidatus Heimdallarchaeota archaeon]|nr:hypothetical protein [Candidatus Heimdallarchaeota archaeon]
MLKNIFILLFLSIQIAFSSEYFVHLTNKGQTYRLQLLQKDYSFLSSTNILQAFKNNQTIFKEILPGKKQNNSLDNWIVLDIDSDIEQFLQSFKDEQIIDFAEPVGHFKIDFESNDSLAHQQWYLDKIDLAKAWQITQGSPEIIVGVIDTGIDYLHPELQQSLWVNQAEDL